MLGKRRRDLGSPGVQFWDMPFDVKKKADNQDNKLYAMTLSHEKQPKDLISPLQTMIHFFHY